MKNKRKRFTAQEKVKILRLHLIEKQMVSDICDRNELNPNVFYSWQKQFFEHGAAAFERTGNGRKNGQVKTLERKISTLKSKLAGKDEVIAEIMASHVRLKKSLGED